MDAPNIKYITIDGRLNADFLPFAQSFTEFPDKIGRVKSFSITSVELPIAFVIDPSYEFCASPRYVYLEVIDRHCYNNHEKKEGCRSEHLFTSNLFSSRISKYILGRITLDYKNYPTGSILPANLFNGFLISGLRKYHSTVRLRDLYFRVLNEIGDPIWFENENISFCLQVECYHE